MTRNTLKIQNIIEINKFTRITSTRTSDRGLELNIQDGGMHTNIAKKSVIPFLLRTI